VKVVENAQYMEGMSASIRAGLDAAAVDTDAVASYLAISLSSHLSSSTSSWHVLPRPGAPCAADRCRPAGSPGAHRPGPLPELRRLEGDLGARELFVAHAEQAEFVQLDDGRAAFDIDTPSDYRSVLLPREGWWLYP